MAHSYPRVQRLDLLGDRVWEGSITIREDGKEVWLDRPHKPGHESTEGLGSVIMGPALVDLYSTSGEPGREDRETLDSMQGAAHHGGFAAVGILPHTLPAIDDGAMQEFWQRQGAWCRPWGALTRGAQGSQLTDLAALAPWVVGLTDGRAIANDLLLYRAMTYLRPLQKPLMLMAQMPLLHDRGVIREGVESVRLGLPAAPVAAETAHLAALLELVRSTQTSVHLMRVTSARAVALIGQAKAEGLPITASTTWMHLCFEAADLVTYDPNLKLWAPLGNGGDRQALITGLKQGVLDAIAVDHTPYTYEEKMIALEDAPRGAMGLELVLPILWHRLVEPGHLTALQLWRSLSLIPAKILNLPLPAAQIIFDPQASWNVDSQNLHSLARNTPFWQQTLRGRVTTWLNSRPDLESKANP
ncbi:MAG: dihydroorotase [Oscillatoriales cyanobacterium SM2_2_1]|nr:dihydroorotase [Oscillatoriales cyanobacterium SM2_2_1]